jgi:hypothetical protein
LAAIDANIIFPSFIQWLTTFNEVVFIDEGIFRKLLRKYQVDPLFILGIGFPNTGCANSSFSYGNNTPDAYRKLHCSFHTTAL